MTAVWSRRIRLHHSRQRDNINLARSGFSKGFGAFIHGRSRGIDVVHQEEVFPGDRPGLGDDKGGPQVFQAVFFAKHGLGRCGSHPA